MASSAINFSISGQASALHMNGFHVAAVVVCMIFVSSLVLLPFANADLTMFRADPSRSGVGTGSPALTPSLIWKYTAGSWVVSSSAVVNGVVYIGSDDHSVYALNATNGIQLWNYTAVGEIESSPGVVNGLIYVGSDDGHVYALGSPMPSSPSPALFNILPIIIGIVIAVVVIAAVVFLMFRKRLKTKPESPL